MHKPMGIRQDVVVALINKCECPRRNYRHDMTCILQRIGLLHHARIGAERLGSDDADAQLSIQSAEYEKDGE